MQPKTNLSLEWKPRRQNDKWPNLERFEFSIHTIFKSIIWNFWIGASWLYHSQKIYENDHFESFALKKAKVSVQDQNRSSFPKEQLLRHKLSTKYLMNSQNRWSQGKTFLAASKRSSIMSCFIRLKKILWALLKAFFLTTKADFG